MAGLFACCMVAHEVKEPLLMLEIYGVSKLKGGDGKRNAFVKLLFDGNNYGRTKVVKNAGEHIEWHAKFAVEHPSGTLRLDVCDEDVDHEGLLGRAEISLEKLRLDQHANHGRNLILKSKHGEDVGVLKLVAYPAFTKSEQKRGGHAWGYGKQGIDWQADAVLCLGDSRQSPIRFNLAHADRSKMDKLHLKLDYTYYPPGYTILNNGHTIEVSVDKRAKTPMGYLHFEKHTYAVDSFHFHAPAEHTIGEHRPALELHIKHLPVKTGDKKDNTAAVLGIFFDEGVENHFLEDLIRCKSFPMHPHDKTTIFSEEDLKARDRFDLQHLVAQNAEILHYQGSLTTPPCSEIVEWFVLAKPLHASRQQIEFFNKLFRYEGSNGNYRVLQNTPENMRNKNTVYMLKPVVATTHKQH